MTLQLQNPLDTHIFSPLNLLERNLRECPQQTALISHETQWNWENLFQSAARYASALLQKGLVPGDKVAYSTADNAEGFLMLWGIWLAGGVASPINCTLPTHLQEGVLDTLKPQYILLGSSTPRFENIDKMIQIKDVPDQGNQKVSFPLHTPDQNDDAMILFTSGSTGVPKGAVSTHKAITLNATRTSHFIRVESTDKILINTPHYYTSAISHMLTLAVAGASVVTRQGFLFWETFVEEIQKHGCTGFGGAPSHFVRLFAPAPKECPSSLRFLVSSGDHLPNHLTEYISEHFSHIDLFKIYGLTETAGRLCILPPSQVKEKPRSVGKSLPGMSVTIRNEDGSEKCSPGETGEIYVSGDMLSHEYLNNPKASQDLRTPWGFRTGDFGIIDKDGFISILGRKDEVFKSGGEKISCQLIQEAIMQLDIFSDAAVIPKKDELMGKTPVVYYAMQADASFSPHETILKLRKALPQSHIPRDFRPITAIPRTGSGKIDRTALKKLASQK